MSVSNVQKSAYSIPVSPEDVAQARKLAEQRFTPPEVIDALLEGLTIARDQKGWGQYIPEPLGRILPPPNMNRGGREVTDASRTALSNILGNAGIALSTLYKDKQLDVTEYSAHQEVGAVLGMFDQIVGLIPPPLMQRLQQQLFAPLNGIAQSARINGEQLQRAKENPALFQRLQKPQTNFVERTVADLEGRSLRGIDRYEIGDAVRVRRSKQQGQPTQWVRGEVIGVTDDRVHVAYPTGNTIGEKWISKQWLEQDNPLKIGDWFKSYGGSIDPGGPRGFGIAVNAVRPDGTLQVQADQGKGWFDLNPKQVEHVVETLTKQLGIAAPGSIAREVAPTPVVNGRQILDRSGGVNMTTVESFEGERTLGALFTDRGIGYKTYNEDGAAIGRFLANKTGKKEVSFSITCDQAGGHAAVLDEKGNKLDGEASRIATEELQKAVESIWNATEPGFEPREMKPEDTLPPNYLAGDPSQGADPRQALLAAVQRAHLRIDALSNSELLPPLTTASAVAVIDGFAYGVNVGDSAVIHYGADGRIKNVSNMDSAEDYYIKMSGGDPNAGLKASSGLLRGVGGGTDYEGDLAKDTFKWKLEPGDYLVTASDGLLDANLMAQKKSVANGDPWKKNHGQVTMENIGTIIAGGFDPEDVANKLLRWTETQMMPDDAQKLGQALLAQDTASRANDEQALRQAEYDELMARGSGKPDNRGFGVLQYLG
jgi:serine/threonine protein phosphatase PrpC